MDWKHFILLILVPGQLNAWNSLGHRIVAQIAIDQLPAGYVKKLSRLNHEMDVVYPPRGLANSSTWMDEIRFENDQWYTSYHYENSYFSEDGTVFPKHHEKHAIWAVKTAIDCLEDNHTSPFNKAMSLRIILHVIGDIHQPLHTISKVSKEHPRGDAGGNYYSLDRNAVGRSLHEYWDNGGGYLFERHPVRSAEFLKKAHDIEKKYPCSFLPIGKVNIQSWVQSSRTKALQKAYGPLKSSSHVTKKYQINAQNTSQYQIALAGCRLAKLLKQTSIAYSK